MATRRFKIDRVPSFDDTLLYYESSGDGLPLVCCNGIGVSTFFWDYLRRYFQGDHRVVLWDYRGHGRSDVPRDVTRTSIQDVCRDLKTVMDADEVDKAVLFGHSMGVQVILEFYRLYPDRVAGLVPICGAYGRPMTTFMDSNKLDLAFPALYLLMDRFADQVKVVWKGLTYPPLAFWVARRMFLNHCMAPRDDFDLYFRHIGELDLRTFINMARYLKDHTTEDLLPRIEAPTLIVAGDQDNFTPHWLSEHMVEVMPRAELLTIRGGSHAAIVEQPDLINLRVEKFLREQVRPALAPARRQAATVL